MGEDRKGLTTKIRDRFSAILIDINYLIILSCEDNEGFIPKNERNLSWHIKKKQIDAYRSKYIKIAEFLIPI